MMTYTFVDSPLWYLQWLRKEKDFDSPLDDQILTLQQELRFTRTYLIYLAMSKGNPFGSSSLIKNVEPAFVNATKDLSSACFRDRSRVDSVVSHMLEEVKHCKQEIRKAYDILWEEPWKSNTPLLWLSVMDFVDSVLDNLKDLLGSQSLIPVIRKNIESLKEKLSFIKRKVVHKKRGVFLIHVQVVATLTACLSYWCWTDEMNETWASRMVKKFSDLLQQTKPCTSDRVDMYFDLMKTSKADEFDSFVNFLQENPAASFQDQIASQRTFSVHMPEEKEYGKSLLTPSETEPRKVTALTYSIHDNRFAGEVTITMNHTLLSYWKRLKSLRQTCM